MDPGRIAIRTVFAYIFLLGLIRASGKRTIAQGTVFDFVFALILGDMIDDLLWADVPTLKFIVAVGALITAHLMFELISFKSEFFSRLVGGSPLMFLRAGSLLRAALRREQMSEKEAEEMLRLKGIERKRWREIKSAWVELNGRPALLRQEWARTAQKKDLQSKSRDPRSVITSTSLE